jgi:large subunit ribosomal protein L31e
MATPKNQTIKDGGWTMSEPEKETEEKTTEDEKAEETPTTPEEEMKAEEEETTEITEEEAKKLPKEAIKEEEEKPEEAIPEEKAEEGIEEEEEEKPKREKELEEDIVEEKFYTIPLRRAWIMPPRKRAPRAIRIIKSFVEKHMKIGVKKEEEETEEEKEERLIISSELNERIWLRGIEKPPRKIKVRVVKDSEGIVTVYPAEGGD